MYFHVSTLTHLFFFKLFVLIFYFILKVIIYVHYKKSNNTQMYIKQSQNPLSSINPLPFYPFTYTHEK